MYKVYYKKIKKKQWKPTKNTKKKENTKKISIGCK